MNTCRYLTSLEATGWMNAVGTALRSTKNNFYARISAAKNTCQLVLLLTIIAIIARIIIIVVIIRLARDVAERVHHGKLVVLIEGEGRTCSPMVMSTKHIITSMIKLRFQIIVVIHST